MDRPNPDEILAKVKAEDTHRGRLKIFFGAVAGVGKTYKMLESARHLKKEGVDIIVGYVETHKRPETEALLEGLEILPPKIIDYKNVKLCEFDIDAALKRKPAVILVDELAHSNAPGSRHLKRLQDVEDILDAGIDVYTTLNVQHCESANDIVAQVTGVTVRETVPDTFIEKADEIELVDIPTEELLKRLKEGKVYLGQQAERAAHHFFQPGNLIALRQLALRFTERSVDSKLLLYKQAHSISKVWGVRDRFLVCISSNPGAVRLVRAGKRIAADLGVEWIVAHVEMPSHMSAEDRNRISEMLRLAETLGAQTATLIGQEVAETLISYARSKNVTKIIVGKPGKPRWQELIFGSIIDKLTRNCGEIDLYFLSGEVPKHLVKSKPHTARAFPWTSLGWTICVIAFCTFVNSLIFRFIAPVNLVMVYLLGVTWIAYRYGRRMSIIASFLSVLFFDFFFVPPYFTVAVSDAEYFITFIIMLAVGFTIAQLTGRLRRQTMAMRVREDHTQALYALTRDLSKSSYPDELFKIAIRHIQDFFQCQAVILTPAANKLAIRFDLSSKSDLNPAEYAVAQWSYEHKKIAGKNTDTLPGSTGVYLPFIGLEKTVGVIGVFPADDTQFIDPDQFHRLEVFVGQTALAVEGAQLAAAALDAESKIENERLRNLILTTFSYELPEPLTSISQTASELLKPENINDESKRAVLIQKIRGEVERLNNLVAELPKVINLEG
jgi:two-component system, OmpR family, sensor histidine kinase KdpD